MKQPDNRDSKFNGQRFPAFNDWQQERSAQHERRAKDTKHQQTRQAIINRVSTREAQREIREWRM